MQSIGPFYSAPSSHNMGLRSYITFFDNTDTFPSILARCRETGDFDIWYILHLGTHHASIPKRYQGKYAFAWSGDSVYPSDFPDLFPHSRTKALEDCPFMTGTEPTTLGTALDYNQFLTPNHTPTTKKRERSKMETDPPVEEKDRRSYRQPSPPKKIRPEPTPLVFTFGGLALNSLPTLPPGLDPPQIAIPLPRMQLHISHPFHTEQTLYLPADQGNRGFTLGYLLQRLVLHFQRVHSRPEAFGLWGVQVTDLVLHSLVQRQTGKEYFDLRLGTVQ